jgi:hypothetical protein
MKSYRSSLAYIKLLMAEHLRIQRMVREMETKLGKTPCWKPRLKSRINMAIRAEKQHLQHINSEMEAISDSGFLPDRTLSIDRILNS